MCFTVSRMALSDVEPIPDYVVQYIAKQINANPDSFSLYAQRDPTKHEHMEEIRQVYGYQNFSTGKYREAAQFYCNMPYKTGMLCTCFVPFKKNYEIKNNTSCHDYYRTTCLGNSLEGRGKDFKALTGNLSEWQNKNWIHLSIPLWRTGKLH